MFKKKPNIKTLSPLRSSDRRKIADQIIADFNVQIPPPPPVEDGQDAAQNNNSNLTSIRNSLLPESSLSARFTTTHGPNLKEVQGTMYVGAHPGEEERILWIRLGQGEGRLFPTVYALWHNPRLVPLLHTPSIVMQKLRGGADLMTPGLAGGPPFPGQAVKNAIVGVATVESPTVPVFVGACEIDVGALEKVQGIKGHAVRGITWEGDEIWGWSSGGKPGRAAPEYLEGWYDEAAAVEDIGDGVKNVDLDGEAEDEQEDGGVALPEPQGQAEQNGYNDFVEGEDGEAGSAENEEKEPTTKEIDAAFLNAFIYAVHHAKTNDPSEPNHGINFPIIPSLLISNFVTPFLPVYTPSQAQYYQIKKTSWKNVKKFIKFLNKQLLVKSKDRNGGETVILDVDFNDRQILEFVPYKLPPRNVDDGEGNNTSKPIPTTPSTNSSDPSIGQILNLITLYRATSKLVPDLIPSKTEFYTHSQISTYLNTYIESPTHEPRLIHQTNHRLVNLNPFLANSILGSGSADDTTTLARGTVPREALLKRVTGDQSLCQPFWCLLRNTNDRSTTKPKPFPAPKITITLEKRTGSKNVTKVTGLEVFHIMPTLLAEELKTKCASATSVGQAVGGKPGVMEVLVQGDQRGRVEEALGRRGVNVKSWVEVMDRSKKGGGGGGGGGRR